MKQLFVVIGMLWLTKMTSAQNGPLIGSGKVITNTLAVNGFDKVEIRDLDGKVEIEVGKAFSVITEVDDNFQSLLELAVKNGTLVVLLKGNRNNRLYVENTHIRIRIAMPEISVLEHNSNSSLVVNGIVGRYFRISNTDNGSATLNGSIDELDIIKSGNGNLRADKLVAKRIKVLSSGNGSVFLNTDFPFNARSRGNGNIINVGKGRADGSTSTTGNGELKYNEENDQEKAARKERVQLKLINPSSHSIELSVIYPVKGSYGIEIKPQQELKERFPVGTKLYRGNQFTLFKKPVYTVTDEKEQQVVIKS
jgi:Putative auto-transporter adhesin, head GIN domain